MTDVAPFDAELFLRLMVEETLLGVIDDRHGFSSRLNDAATALVAVGAIDVPQARAVLGDHAAAETARDGYGDILMARFEATEQPRPPVRPSIERTVALDQEIQLEQGNLRLRYVLLGHDRTELAAAFRLVPGPDHTTHHARTRSLGGMPLGIPTPVLGDDHGQTTGLDFSGSGSDDGWEGTLAAARPLAPDTQWLEIYGHRVALDREPVRSTVAVEPLPDTDPAHAHLWRRVALGDRHPMPGHMDAAIDALVRCGALAAEDGSIELAREVKQALPGNFGRRSSATAVARRAPEPWPSLLRRADRTDGPLGMVVVGAVTPEFDGHFVAVYSVESGAAQFRVEAAVSPPDTERHPGNLDLEDTSLVWWARDDRGNHYLGVWDGSRGDEDTKTGTLAFSPALDPLAQRLDVMPTGRRERAVISFPLPWRAKRS